MFPRIRSLILTNNEAHIERTLARPKRIEVVDSRAEADGILKYFPWAEARPYLDYNVCLKGHWRA